MASTLRPMDIGLLAAQLLPEVATALGLPPN